MSALSFEGPHLEIFQTFKNRPKPMIYIPSPAGSILLQLEFTNSNMSASISLGGVCLLRRSWPHFTGLGCEFYERVLAFGRNMQWMTVTLQQLHFSGNQDGYLSLLNIIDDHINSNYIRAWFMPEVPELNRYTQVVEDKLSLYEILSQVYTPQ
jgi:hypothetical protein